MKKYIVYGFLVLSMVLPSVSIAEEVGDYDPNPNTRSCVSINSNLRYQDRDANTNGEVSTLQDLLQAKGYLNSEPTGYFGLLTVSAVKNFQTASGISATGYVGPLTRTKIKAGSCGGVTVAPPPSMTGVSSGCYSTSGYSSITGEPCSTKNKFPAGCTSSSGFSFTTGLPCGQTDYAEPKVEVKSNNGEKVVNINKGEFVYIHWTSQNTFSCTAVGSSWDRSGLSGTLVTSGYIGVRPEVSGEYTISCKGIAKTVSDSMKVNVNSVPTCSSLGYDTKTGFRCGCYSTSGYSSITGEPCGGNDGKFSLDYLTANGKENITIKNGDAVALTWGTKGASFCYGYPAWYPGDLTGVKVMYPNQTTNYTLTCSGPNQSSIAKTVNVTVEASENVSSSCTIQNFTASPSSVTVGGEVVLNWTTSSDCASLAMTTNNGTTAPIPSGQSGNAYVSPPFTTTYTLYAAPLGGGNTTKAVTVMVNPEALPDGCTSSSGYSSTTGEPCS